MKKILLLLVFFNVTSISFAQEKTRVVERIYIEGEFLSVWHICENHDIPEQIIKTRPNFPGDAIKLGWDDGYAITDISYGGGYWSLVMDKGKNFGRQRYFGRSNVDDLKKKIKEGWDEGFRIHDISYGDGYFYVIMSEDPPHGNGAQTWFTRNNVDNFLETTQEYWDDDYRLIEAVYANGSWFAFMQKESNFSAQAWRGRNEFPIDAIEALENDGKLLTSLATDGKYWIGIFSKVNGCYAQLFGDPDKEKPNKKPSSAGSGTGFAVNSGGYIATNFHVIDGASSITVKGVYGDLETSYNAKVIVEDQRNDLAILKIDKWLGEIPYSINRSTLGLANEVYALGYPLTSLLGIDIKFTDGKIGATTGFENDPTYYQHSAPIQPGNSGGPLFSSSGNLIAINTLRVNQDFAITEGIFFSVKARYLMNLMEDINIPFPSSGGLKNYNIPQQVERIKKFVYLIEVN